MENNKKTTKQKIARDLTIVNAIYTVLAIIANGLVAVSIFNVTRYSGLSKEIFMLVNIGALLVLLALNLGLVMLIRTKKSVFFTAVSAVLVVTLLLGGYGVYATSSINKNIQTITNPGGTESVDTSFVVMEDSSISSLVQMNGKQVGVVSGTTYTDLGEAEIEKNQVTVTYVEYQDYIALALGLFTDEVDVAIFPSNYVGQLEVNEGLEDSLSETVVIHSFSEVIESEVLAGADKDITAEPFTVLILGIDEGRSDALMVASVNPISMRVTLTSIARDSYVPIACYSGQASDKIGHARVRSRECTIDTVENLLDIEIDFYFESNFKGIVDMVDALGGITVYNEFEFVGQNSSSTRGKMTVFVPGGGDVYLNGEQALTFARERKLYAMGDFQRQANQQQVITSILREVMRSQDINKVIAMLDAAGENVSTNLSTDQMVAFFNYTMKKTARFYDKEHYERIFDIVSNRIVGYDSGLWNESTQTSIYIYRLYKGSIEDTRNAILRNIDMESEINAVKSLRWNANWIFDVPTIGSTAYNETKIPPEVPSTIGNFVGLPVGRLQSWAKVFGIQVNIRYVGEGMQGFDNSLRDGTIVSQDVAAGTSASNFSVINVNVIQRGAEPTIPECEEGEVYDEETGQCIVETENYKVTIIYVDKTTGNEITSLAYADEFETGTTYSISVQKEGYEPVKQADITVQGITTSNPFTFANGKVSGTMMENNIKFIVKVKPKSTVASYTLSINYLDSTGATLQPAQVVTLQTGANYTVVAPVISGYTFTAFEGTTNGSNVTMGSANMSVTVRYAVTQTPTPSPEPSIPPTEVPPVTTAPAG